MIIRTIHSNTIAVPKQTSFHIPRPGAYSSTIRSITKKTGLRSFIRLVFNVQVPNADLDYLAKLDVPQDMREGSELWTVLCQLLGRKRLQELSGKALDLDALVGVACDIEVEHVVDRDGGYEFPLVVVTNLREAGTLVAGANLSKEASATVTRTASTKL